jgi:hypothetical protein
MFGDGGAGEDEPCANDGSNGAHVGALACNNVIWDDGAEKSDDDDGAFFDTGIASWAACETILAHNTVFSTDSEKAFASLEGRFENSSTQIVNNLTNIEIRSRDDATVERTGNTTDAAADLFADAEAGDLSLVGPGPAGADLSGIARVASVCDVDVVGVPRDLAAPTAGAHEPP